MAPGRKRGAKRAKTKVELSLGDLVLAKIKGFPAWPAKISRPEDWERLPDPKKYFVQFFGTLEIAFVAPADVQSFTIEVKTKLSARCQGKKDRYFTQAVKEICEEFEQLQHKNSSIVRDDESTQTLASQAHLFNPVVDESEKFDGNNGTDIERPKDNLEIKGSSDLACELEPCLQRHGEVEFQGVKPCLSDGVNSDEPTSVSSGKKSKLSTDHTNVARDSVSVSSPCLKEQSSHDFEVEGMHSDVGQKELTNGHRRKLATGSKKKPKDTMSRNSGSSSPCEQRKFASGGNIMVSSADISRSDSGVSGEKKEKVLIKDKLDFETANDGRDDSEGNFEKHIKSTSKKKMNAKHGHAKQKFRTNKSSLTAKLSKCADTGNDMARADLSRKSDSKSPNVLDDKMGSTKSKRLTSGGKAENRCPVRVQAITHESNHSSDEDDFPPRKRHCQALPTRSSSASLSENRLGSNISHKTDLVFHNKVRPPVIQLPAKRRAVRLCDDEDDESPKTPVHGEFSNKASAIPCPADSQEKVIMQGENNAENQHVSRNVADNALKDQVQAAQQGIERRTGELSRTDDCPSSLQLETAELPSTEAKPVLLSPKGSPQSVGGTRLPTEPHGKHSCKALGNVSLKKIPARDSSSTTASDRPISIVNQLVGERSKSALAEKRKTTPKSGLRINDPVLVVGTKSDSAASLGERLDIGKDDKMSFPIDSKQSGSDLSMKHLIAAAQARKRQAHSQSSSGNPLLLLFPEADMPGPGPIPTLAELPSESSKMLQLEVQGLHSTSPSSYLHQLSSSNQYENEDHVERKVSSAHQGTLCPLSGGTEAAVVRDAFEGIIETLSRTKESIGRATRLASDCAKHGIANEVVELLIQKLENESSLHRRVDLFFLVDSITQYSHSQRGIAGVSYIPIVQEMLPRLIGAVAPAGTTAQENRRQCRKVLRLWLERKIFPESILRHYMDVMGVVNDNTSTGFSLRRPSRTERAFDDPIREMEGMVVDEYGSNTTFKLPGLLSAPLFEEEEEYEDQFPNKLYKVDDASPTKVAPATSSYLENPTVTPIDRCQCLLKDVDDELEMEDVSGHPKDEKSLISSFEYVPLEPNSDGILESSSNKCAEWLLSPEGSPPLPPESPPVTPPLPSSPPTSSSPLPPPPPPASSPTLLPLPPPPPPPSSQQHLYPHPPVCPPAPHVGPPSVGLAPPPPPVGLTPPPVAPPTVATHLPSTGPPLPPQQLIPLHCQFMSHHMTPLASAISHSSPQAAYQPPPLLHDVGGTSSGNQCTHMVSNAHGPQIDGFVRTDVRSNHASCITPPGVNTAQEHVAYSSLRHVEYGQDDAYMNPHGLQHQQQLLPGGARLSQRPVHPELPPRCQPNDFSYQSSIQQRRYTPCSMPSFSEDPRRYAIDEQWRMQVNEQNAGYPSSGWGLRGRPCSGQPYSHEGYFGPPPERPLASTVNFQPSAPNNLPSAAHFPVHGGPIMANRPDLYGVNQ